MGSLSGKSRNGLGAGAVTIGTVRLDDLASGQQPVEFPPAQDAARTVAFLFVLRGAARFQSIVCPDTQWTVSAPATLYSPQRELLLADLDSRSRVLAVTASLPGPLQPTSENSPKVVCPESISVLIPSLSFFLEVYRRSHGRAVQTSLAAAGACIQVLDNLVWEINAASLPVNSSADALFQHAVRYIESNYSTKDLGPHQIAEAMAVSTRQLQRSFQRQGRTVLGVIRQVRVGQASTLLISGSAPSQSMEAVADLVGFSSARELRRALNRAASPSWDLPQKP